MPKVSVLIPVYNNETYLRQCLGSVANQTLKDIEIICLNDGSTDRSLRIMEEFGAKDNRVKVINKINTGYGDTLNQGLELSTGEYVAIVESDDFLEEKMFEVLYNNAVKKHLDIIKSNYYEYKSNSGAKLKCLINNVPYNKIFTPADYYDMFTGEIYLWTSLYKKRFLEVNDIKFNKTPGASYQDVSFTFKALACAKSVMSIEEAFYHYRLDNPNSSVKSKEKVYCICDEFDEIERFCKKRPDVKEKMRKIIPYMMYKRYMGTYWRIDIKFKAEFLERLKKDMGRYSQEEINREIWSAEDWETYTQLDEQFVKDYAREQMKVLLEPAVVLELKDKCIYVYGAGQVGQRVRDWLEEHGLNFNGYLITEQSKAQCVDSSVRIYAEIKDELSSNAYILVSVGDKLQGEIISYLMSEGQKNVLSMNSDMRYILNI